MDKMMDWLKKYATVTLTVAALGLGFTVGFGANGCSVEAVQVETVP